MNPDLKAAVLGAQNVSTPTSPLGNFPELAKMYQVNFQAPQAAEAVNVAGSMAQDQVDTAKKAAAAAKEAAQAINDPKRYSQVSKNDGGYDFYYTDPAGNKQQVDIATFSKNTGYRPSEIVKDSQNPIDIQYVNDYNNLQGFMQAVVSKDREKIKAYVDQAKTEGVDLAPYTQDTGGLHKLIEQFQKNYQRYYVPRTQNANAWGMTPGQPNIPIGSADSGAGPIGG